MSISRIRLALATAILSFCAGIGAAHADIDVSQNPLFTIAGQPPLMMMVMSRDEQLFNKAYSDYTDLDGDRLIDTTYQDRFDYSGYFDSHLCYTYGTQFKASAAATGINRHSCGGKWSGNFLNWLTMSRLDVLRYVLFGGLRSTDDANKTVLERANIPSDLHAWTKIYNGTDINQYSPYTAATTFCNASFSSAGDPQMLVANGEWPAWAATESKQCALGNGSDTPGSAAATLTVRVEVCDPASSNRESFCQSYGTSSKPVGLLQNYGEKGQMRFGLLTGSFSKPRSGGVLRRNIGKLAGNGSGNCAIGDEINLSNGTFCNTAASGVEGIINTINSLKLTQWSGSTWSDCNQFGILNRQGGSPDRYLDNPGSGSNKYSCNAWGNPLSEMYAEALKYFAAEAKTAGFSATGDLAGLPNPAWLDPYRSEATGGSPYCAKCNILVLSTGLNSFDGDEVPSVAALNSNAADATNTVGALEGISGTYLVGRSLNHLDSTQTGTLAVGQAANTYQDLCTAKMVDDLSQVRGLCPDIPAMEGSYLLSGLAYKAWTTDLRPGLKDSRGGAKPAIFKNNVKTFSVALSENLPKFSIPVSGGGITLAPLCQSNTSGSAAAGDDGWRSCFLGAVAIGSRTAAIDNGHGAKYIYGRPMEADASAGSFSLTWEDSLWGNDHDLDVMSMLTYCAGGSGSGKCSRATDVRYNVPGANIPWSNPVCFYTAKNYGGAEFCPTQAQATGNMPSSHDQKVVSVKVQSGYPVTLYSKTNQSTSLVTLTSSSADLGTSNSNKARSYSITPPHDSVYSGYDICWRSDSPVCTGANNTPQVAADEALVRIENLYAYAGNGMLTGYAVTGSSTDGLQRVTRRPGNSNASVFTTQANPPGDWDLPKVMKFKLGSSSAKQLQNPLFYAAKFGSFNDLNGNGKPDAGEWDSQVAGVPDNFFAVTNPAKLKAQLAKIFDQVLADAKPTASVATSTPRYVNGATLAYEASFDGKDWTGDLKAYRIRSDGVYAGVPPVWKASDKLPTPSNRKIFTSKPQVGTFTGQGIEFTTNATRGLPAAMQTTLMAGLDTAQYNIDDVLAYLRGDQSKEQNQTPPGPYRTRGSHIGDVLNSSPAVAAVTSYGYGQLLSGIDATAAGKYAAFVEQKKTYYGAKSDKPVVFFGANDGMLHAISGSEIGDGGKELFAYIPNAAIDQLNELVKPSYTHRYFADGSPTLTDAYIGGNWKSVLVASTGAGSRSVYALNVTTPLDFKASDVMWEFNSNAADAEAMLMGQFTGRPWVGVADDGNWVATFGNGYNSDGNQAVLFIRNLADGTKVATITIPKEAQCGSGEQGCGPDNGLGMAVLADNDASGAGDTIYAGDYLGNLWRFEYVAGNWKLGNGDKPLFVAKDPSGKRQSITSGVYTVANPLGGTMVVFGTGRYLDAKDADAAQIGQGTRASVDTIYGVLDSRQCEKVSSAGQCTSWTDSGVIAGRTDLQPQSITSYTPLASDGSGGYRTATRNGVNYRTAENSAGKMGWYLDLSYKPGAKDYLAGERVTVRPDGILGDVIINTIRPEGDTCEPGVQNATMVLDALTGAADYIPVPPAGGWPTGQEPPAGMVGTETYRGPPQGEPPILIIHPGNPGVPCLAGSSGCTPPCDPVSDPNCPNPAAAATSCSWRSPNPTGHPPGKPMPCGRISWKQLR